MASLKKAIEAKCKDCIYDELDTGSWRQQTENCTSKDCPLWEVRPVTIKSRDAARTPSKKSKGTDAKLVPLKEVA
jgi:hypothetical protein